MHIRLPVSMFFLVSTLVAAMMLVNSNWMFILLTQAILIGLATWLLSRLPARLAMESRDNCYRMDGSRSSRRYARELVARRRASRDILALLLLVAISGNWGVYFVHTQLMPLPMAAKAFSMFDPSEGAWKANMHAGNLERDYAAWHNISHGSNSEQIDLRKRTLWYSWPFIAAMALVWCSVSLIAIREYYARILMSFGQGVRRRSSEYVKIDVTRLQSESDLQGTDFLLRAETPEVPR